MSRNSLSRRTLLRGAGLGPIAIALPRLEAMAQAPRTPLRLVTWFFPNGIVGGGGSAPEHWWPPESQAGAAWTFTRGLKPLEPFRSDLLLLKNLDKPEMFEGQEFTTDAHVRGHGTFATGSGITKDGVGGPSVDQVVAGVIGKDSRFKSLPVAIGKGTSRRMSNISWSGPTSAVPCERDPVALFTRLFGERGASTADPLVDHRKSILDFVRGDATRLRARVGMADRQRLDEHLTSLREVEQQVQTVATAPGMPAGACGPPADLDPSAVTAPLSNEQARLLMRMMVMALACDMTRVATFMLAGRNDMRQFPWLGIPNRNDGHHGISHDWSAAGFEAQSKIVVDEMEQFAYMLGLMKASREGGATLLDNSVVFCANEHQHGFHAVNVIPVILAGRAGGKLKSGRYVVYPKGTRYANVLVSIQNLFGIEATTFGRYGRGPLPNLT